MNDLLAKIIVLDQQGTVVAVNRCANWLTSREALKLPLNVDVGSNFLQICREAEREGDSLAGQLVSGLESVFTGRKEYFTMDYSAALPSKQPYLSLSIVPIFQPSPCGCVIALLDRPPLRPPIDTERALQRDVLTLESRLFAISELAAGITHELTQPLTAMSYYCETFQALGENLKEQQEAATHMIDRISLQAARAMKLVAQLRDFTRKAAPNLSDLSLISLLQRVIELTETLAQEQNVHLSLSTPEDLPLVVGDPEQLRQVLMHLLRNAIEATGPMANRDRCVAVVATHEVKWVHVSVKDNGPGMDRSMNREIFDVIKTSTSQHLGFGLGICQSIVKAHGGRLWLASASPQGSCFQFTLPVAGQTHAP